MWLICPEILSAFPQTMTGNILASLICGSRSIGGLASPYLQRTTEQNNASVIPAERWTIQEKGQASRAPRFLRSEGLTVLHSWGPAVVWSLVAPYKTQQQCKTRAKIPSCLLAKNVPWKCLPFFVAEAMNSGSQLIWWLAGQSWWRHCDQWLQSLPMRDTTAH